MWSAQPLFPAELTLWLPSQQGSSTEIGNTPKVCIFKLHGERRDKALLDAVCSWAPSPNEVFWVRSAALGNQFPLFSGGGQMEGCVRQRMLWGCVPRLFPACRMLAGSQQGNLGLFEGCLPEWWHYRVSWAGIWFLEWFELGKKA